MNLEHTFRRSCDARLQGELTASTLPEYPRTYYYDKDLSLYAYVDVAHCISERITTYNTVWYDLEGIHSGEHLTYDELVQCLNNLFLSELFEDMKGDNNETIE